MFDPRKQELREIKHKAHEACRQYNVLDEYDPRREEVLRGMLGKVGQVFYFQGPVQFNYGSHTFIGENFFANFNLTVMDDGKNYNWRSCLLWTKCFFDGDLSSIDFPGKDGTESGRENYNGRICSGDRDWESSVDCMQHGCSWRSPYRGWGCDRCGKCSDERYPGTLLGIWKSVQTDSSNYGSRQ